MAQSTSQPHVVGARSEAMVLAALVRRFDVVLVPFGGHHRFDFMVEKDGDYLRIQAKTGRLRHGAIVFNSCSSHWHYPTTGQRTRDYFGSADLFGVYCQELATVYLAPVALFSKRQGMLHVDRPRLRRSLLASDYQLLSFGE